MTVTPYSSKNLLRKNEGESVEVTSIFTSGQGQSDDGLNGQLFLSCRIVLMCL